MDRLNASSAGAAEFVRTAPVHRYELSDQMVADQFLPATDLERTLAQVAMADLGRHRETGGIYLALVVADPWLRDQTATAGPVLPLRS